ncbi:Na-translocating system protein MpsC family protein [Baekduia sp. Peel2402]|uniref:Na-translocating system protein MpsC family protein n=1 Tax=Baekduia sp. Peel2402 TaxID=3458296 RepID=UPI00403E53C0
MASDPSVQAVGDETDHPGAVTAQISNEMVRLYKELFGRGPTQARTHFAGPNAILVTLENSMTPAEHTMAELGEHQRLRDVRLLFQYAREQDFRGTIERITGRTVRGFVSGMDVAQDIASEVFYLEP